MSNFMRLAVYVGSASGLIPIMLAFTKYKWLDKSLKAIFYFLLLSLAGNIINIICGHFHKVNLYMTHIYTIFEFAFISFFYYNHLTGIVKKIIPFLVAAFTLICLIDFFFLQDYKLQYNSYTRAIDAVVVLFYVMLFFLKQGEIDHNQRFTELSENWVNIGFFIFYSCNFFVLAFSNYLLSKGVQAAFIAWIAYDIFLIAENILFAIAFYKCKKRLITSLY